MAIIFLANYVLLPVDCHGEITKNLSSFWHAKVLRVKRKYILLLIIIGDIAASTILKNEPPEFLETLNQWISFKTLKRCYRASEDGWHAQVFHLQCGELGKTVTLIKVGRYIFGGYSDKSWGNGKCLVRCYNILKDKAIYTSLCCDN